VERGLALGMPGEVVEEALAVDVLVGGAALPHRLQQPGRRVVVHLAPGEGRTVHQAQTGSELGEGEPPVLLLGQDVVGHQAPQHAHQGIVVGAHGVGDLGPGPRSVGKHVGDAELRRDVQELGRDEAVDQAHQPPRRRDGGLLH
jgi:hypothetical protein